MGFTAQIKPWPDHTLTRVEWEAYMRPTITCNGQTAFDYQSDEAGAHRVVWLDGRVQPVGPQDNALILIALDPRYIYDQNRSIIDVRPEYRGEPENWDLNT